MAKKKRQFTYKNTSGRTQTLVGVGQFKPGETFNSFVPVANPNFTLVTTSKANKQAKAREDQAAPMDDRATVERVEQSKENK